MEDSLKSSFNALLTARFSALQEQLVQDFADKLGEVLVQDVLPSPLRQLNVLPTGSLQHDEPEVRSKSQVVLHDDGSVLDDGIEVPECRSIKGCGGASGPVGLQLGLPSKPIASDFDDLDLLSDPQLCPQTLLVIYSRWEDIVLEALAQQQMLQNSLTTWSAKKYIDVPLVLRSHWMISDQKVSSCSKGSLSWIGNSNADNNQIGDFLQGNGYLDYLVGYPHGRRPIIWGFLAMTIMGYEALTIPLQVFDMGYWTELFQQLQLVTLVYWCLDVPMSCFCGFQNEDGLVEMRASHVRRAYFKKQFPIDGIIIAIDVLLLILDDSGMNFLQSGSKAFRLFRFLRFLRLLRLIRMSKAQAAFRYSVNLARSSFTILGIKLVCQLLGIMLIAHYIGCSWLVLAELRDGEFMESGTTWVIAYGLEEDGFGELYTVALHWALTQFSPATNNIAPQNPGERIFAICVVVFALVVFSSFISSLTNNVNQARAALLDFRTQEMCLRRFMSERGISADLFTLSLQFFKQNFAKRKFRMLEADVKFFKELPESFQVRFHAEVYMPILHTIRIFEHGSDMDEALIVRICHNAISEMTHVRGADIFIDGNDARMAYYIQGGQLSYQSVFHENAEVVSVGKWMSEITLWVQWVHRGRLCATMMCDITMVDEQALHELMARQSSDFLTMLRRFAILFFTHVQEMQDGGVAVTDLPVDTEVVRQLVKQASRVSMLTMHGWGSFFGP